MICPNCGAHFRVSEARNEFEAFFHYDLEYDYDVSGRLCGSCAISEMQGQMISFSADDDDDAIPEGCLACGGDYPNCRDSCSLFDD